jgi:hypothetical protein
MQELVQVGDAARKDLADNRLLIESREEVRKDHEALRGQAHIMGFTPKIGPAKLTDTYGAAIVGRVQVNDTMAHKLQIVIRIGLIALRSEHYRRSLFNQETEKGEYLLAELESVSGEKTELSYRIEKDTLGFEGLDLCDDLLGKRTLFDLSGREDIIAFVLGKKVHIGTEIEKVNGFQVQPNAPRILADFVWWLTERNA